MRPLVGQSLLAFPLPVLLFQLFPHLLQGVFIRHFWPTGTPVFRSYMNVVISKMKTYTALAHFPITQPIQCHVCGARIAFK